MDFTSRESNSKTKLTPLSKNSNKLPLMPTTNKAKHLHPLMFHLQAMTRM